MKKATAWIATILASGLIWSSALPNVREELVQTPAEQSRFTVYSQIPEITRFISRLDALHSEMNVRIIGSTLPTTELAAQDLFLCLLTERGARSPADLDRDKPTVYIVAAKHGNEQSAKEAALRMIRDLLQGDLRPLLKKVNFLIFPVANPYGTHFDQRRNEQGIDLNRDQVKLESPEADAINHVFRVWMPEVTIDVHEKGYDYYQVNIGCVSNANIDPDIQSFSRQVVLKEMERDLKAKDIPFHEYLVRQAMGIDSSAGVRYREEDLKNQVMMTRYSTTDINDGRNSPGIYQTLSFIQEVASLHDLNTLEERTRYQYYGLRFLAESVARHGSEINALIRGKRAELLAEARVYNPDDRVHLRMRYVRDPRQPWLTIKRFARSDSAVRGILRTLKKAGEVITAADLEPYPYAPDTRLLEETVENWFPGVASTLSVVRPLGYVIPAAHADVVETLLHHGIKVAFFRSDSFLDVETYLITEIKPSAYDYLAPEKIEVNASPQRLLVKKGDFYVSCAQPGVNLIPCLLEPQSQYGLIRYWKYGLVLEQGRIFPIFRVVDDRDLSVVLYKGWFR